MISLILYLLLSLFYGAFAYFAFMGKAYIAFASLATAFLLTFPVIRILLKPRDIVAMLMLFLSFVFFFAGVYTFQVTSLPFPSMSEIAAYLRGPLLGL